MKKLLAEGVVEFQPRHYRIGPAPDEIILHHLIASGMLQGPRIELSAVANSGVEWATMRGDGVMVFDLRQVLCTASGDLVCATLSGLYDVGDEGYVDALDDVLASRARAEIVIRFNTAARDYRWLNRTLFIGNGQRDFGAHTLTLRIFSVEKAGLVGLQMSEDRSEQG